MNNTEKEILKEIEEQLSLKEIIENTNDDILRDKLNKDLLDRIEGWGHYQILQAKLSGYQLAQKETAEKVRELKETMHKIESEEGDYEDMWTILYGEIDKIFKEKT